MEVPRPEDPLQPAGQTGGGAHLVGGARGGGGAGGGGVEELVMEDPVMFLNSFVGESRGEEVEEPGLVFSA